MVKKRYEGGCHCGQIRFVVYGDLGHATLCNCSICVKKGFVHLIIPPEDFTLVSGKSYLTIYQFNTKIAQHQFCKKCGIHPFYIPRSDPDKIDVNVRCFDDIDLESLKPSIFDGKNWEEAIQGELSWRSSKG